MRMLPTRARLAGAGLAIAALTIIVLAVMILVDLEREVELHRAVIAAQQVKDSLDKLRTHLNELRAAARLGALTGDSSAFVDVGTKVDEDTVVCIIEAMKVMNEIKAETSGVIAEIVAENTKPVQFGQVLFRVR